MLDTLIQFFAQWGYLGLFLGSFLAGSIVPFSSEALVIACVGPLHMDPVISLFVALAGNVSGGMTCYYIGHLGKIEWIEKYAHAGYRHQRCPGLCALQCLDCPRDHDHRQTAALRRHHLGFVETHRPVLNQLFTINY